MEMARTRLPLVLLILTLAVSSAGCELVEGIFKAGLWVGIILVVMVAVLVMWLVGKVRR